jgi:hypothetical protein
MNMEIESNYIYEVYRAFDCSKGCASSWNSEELLFRTKNRELVKQVFVSYLTSVPPGEYIEPRHLKIVKEALRRFDD